MDEVDEMLELMAPADVNLTLDQDEMEHIEASQAAGSETVVTILSTPPAPTYGSRAGPRPLAAMRSVSGLDAVTSPLISSSHSVSTVASTDTEPAVRDDHNIVEGMQKWVPEVEALLDELLESGWAAKLPSEYSRRLTERLGGLPYEEREMLVHSIAFWAHCMITFSITKWASLEFDISKTLSRGTSGASTPECVGHATPQTRRSTAKTAGALATKADTPPTNVVSGARQRRGNNNQGRPTTFTAIRPALREMLEGKLELLQIGLPDSGQSLLNSVSKSQRGAAKSYFRSDAYVNIFDSLCAHPWFRGPVILFLSLPSATTSVDTEGSQGASAISGLINTTFRSFEEQSINKLLNRVLAVQHDDKLWDTDEELVKVSVLSSIARSGDFCHEPLFSPPRLSFPSTAASCAATLLVNPHFHSAAREVSQATSSGLRQTMANVILACMRYPPIWRTLKMLLADDSSDLDQSVNSTNLAHHDRCNVRKLHPLADDCRYSELVCMLSTLSDVAVGGIIESLMRDIEMREDAYRLGKAEQAGTQPSRKFTGKHAPILMSFQTADVRNMLILLGRCDASYSYLRSPLDELAHTTSMSNAEIAQSCIMMNNWDLKRRSPTNDESFLYCDRRWALAAGPWHASGKLAEISKTTLSPEGKIYWPIVLFNKADSLHYLSQVLAKEEEQDAIRPLVESGLCVLAEFAPTFLQEDLSHLGALSWGAERRTTFVRTADLPESLLLELGMGRPTVEAPAGMRWHFATAILAYDADKVTQCVKSFTVETSNRDAAVEHTHASNASSGCSDLRQLSGSKRQRSSVMPRHGVISSDLACAYITSLLGYRAAASLSKAHTCTCPTNTPGVSLRPRKLVEHLSPAVSTPTLAKGLLSAHTAVHPHAPDFVICVSPGNWINVQDDTGRWRIGWITSVDEEHDGIYVLYVEGSSRPDWLDVRNKHRDYIAKIALGPDGHAYDASLESSSKIDIQAPKSWKQWSVTFELSGIKLSDREASAAKLKALLSHVEEQARIARANERTALLSGLLTEWTAAGALRPEILLDILQSQYVNDKRAFRKDVATWHAKTGAADSVLRVIDGMLKESV